MPAPPGPALTTIQPAHFMGSHFLERLIRFLMPFFLTITPDIDAARAEILDTLASYGARTRSEMINAAQIIAFSFSALDMLAEAKATEMSPSLRLRFRGCANNLNRACQQNETTLAKRLASDLPDTVEPIADPVNDVAEAAVHEALQQAQNHIANSRNRLPGGRPATTPHAASHDRNPRLGASPTMTMAARQAMPELPAA